MQRQSTEKEQVTLLDFNPNVRALMRAAKSSFAEFAAEIDRIDDELGVKAALAYKGEAAIKMRELLHQEKGAALGDPTQQPLNREERQNLEAYTQAIQEQIFWAYTTLLEQKLLEKAKAKFNKLDDSQALAKYIGFLNKNRKKEHTGRLLAAVLNYIYDQQKNFLETNPHEILEAVKALQLNPLQQTQYGFDKVGASAVREDKQQEHAKQAKQESEGKRSLSTTTSLASRRLKRLSGDLSGKFFGSKKEDRDRLDSQDKVHDKVKAKVKDIKGKDVEKEEKRGRNAQISPRSQLKGISKSQGDLDKFFKMQKTPAYYKPKPKSDEVVLPKKRRGK